MFLKKLKCIFLCIAAVLSGILLSGCDSSSAELVDEITAETSASVTVETTKAIAETVSETTTVTTTETTTEITTTETATEVTTKTTTEANTEVPTPTETATKIQTETTIESTTEAPSETTIETTTETTQPINLTPEELEVYNSMPDIVFVLSHQYMIANRPTKYTNIRGFYITKNGEVKMYAFSDEEERKYTDVSEIYNELKNVTCSELLFRQEGDEILQSDLDAVPVSYLIKLYKELLLVDKKSETEERDSFESASYGIYELYGIRTNKNGEKEIILLSLKGDYYRTNKDIHAQEINTEIYESISPFSYYRIL